LYDIVKYVLLLLLYTNQITSRTNLKELFLFLFL